MTLKTIMRSISSNNRKKAKNGPIDQFAKMDVVPCRLKLNPTPSRNEFLSGSVVFTENESRPDPMNVAVMFLESFLNSCCSAAWMSVENLFIPPRSAV